MLFGALSDWKSANSLICFNRIILELRIEIDWSKFAIFKRSSLTNSYGFEENQHKFLQKRSEWYKLSFRTDALKLSLCWNGKRYSNVQWVEHKDDERQTLVPQRHRELMEWNEYNCLVCNRVKRLKGARAVYKQSKSQSNSSTKNSNVRFNSRVFRSLRFYDCIKVVRWKRLNIERIHLICIVHLSYSLASVTVLFSFMDPIYIL